MSSRYDEHAQYERPRRHTRPRTKDRPSYDDATTARVVTIDRGRYTLLVDDADGRRTVMAMKSRPLGRQGVVVGDEVKVVGDTSGAPDTLARIVEVDDRRTVLRRTADDDDPIERIIVANAEQLVIVTALADPPPRSSLIDRCLVAAYDARMDPLLCLTKSDLASPDSLVESYAPLGVETVAVHQSAPLETLRARLSGRISVLVGHSGVGKSTLVNRLVPEADRVTSDVNEITGRGRHTSTSAVAFALPGGGLIVDTPGIRSFGLAHVEADRLIDAFPDLAEVARDCPRGCTHLADEPECALDTSDQLDPRRVTSFRRVLTSLSTPAY